MFVERSVSYLEALRIGAIGIFLRLAVFYEEEEQVKSTEDRDKPSEDIIPGLTDIMETPHTHSKTGEAKIRDTIFGKIRPRSRRISMKINAKAMIL